MREHLSKQVKTVRGKLFFTLCIVVLSIILFLILVNSFVLEKYYQYTKSNQLKTLYDNSREEGKLLYGFLLKNRFTDMIYYEGEHQCLSDEYGLYSNVKK